MSSTIKSGRARDGFTMVEVLVSVSLAGLLLSINAVWLYQSMKFSSRISQRHRDHQNLTRLASEFRDDVRRCQVVELVGDNEIKLTAEVADSSDAADVLMASYKIVRNEVVLTKQTGGPQTRSERFTLSENSVIHWDDSELPETIALLVFRDPAIVPDRRSKENLNPESAGSLPTSPPQEMVPLMNIRVSSNRWGISLEQEPETEANEIKTEAGSEPETEANEIKTEAGSEPATESSLKTPQNKAELNVEKGIEKSEEAQSATK